MSILTPERAAFVDEVHYAVAGTVNRDGTPQQTVVWYLREGDTIRLSVGAHGVKARNLRRRGVLTLTLNAGRRYLTLAGPATVEPADADLRRRLTVRYRGPEGADAYLARRPDAPRLSIRMRIERVYGQGV